MKGADQAPAALQACNRAADGAAAVKQYEAKVAAIPAPSPISYAAPATAAAPPTQVAPPRLSQTGQAGAPTASSATVESRLKKLDQLLKQGLITKKEYDEKKADILKDL